MTEEDRIANFCCQVGQTLLESGSEINRVETTVEYIGHKAGLDLECYAELGVIFVYYHHSMKNQIMKVKDNQLNFQKVDEINDLSRRYVANDITYKELQISYRRIKNWVIDFTLWKKILGAGLVSIAPMLLFNTKWINLLLSFFIGIVGYLGSYGMSKINQRPYLNVACGGIIIGILATLTGMIYPFTNPEKIIFSALMPLVPGVALTNSFRELMTRNILSGVILGLDAATTALAISSSVIIGRLIVNWLGGIL